MSYGWITVAGLVLDIVGFALLAWDVLPEYQIYRWRALTDIMHRPDQPTLSILSDHRERRDDPMAQMVADMRYITPLQALRRKLGLEPADTLARADLVELLLKWKEEMREAINVKERALHRRRRPPLKVGISLVLFGFLLQTIGTIGSMN